MTFLEDAVEDAILSILETDGKIASSILVCYTPEEWVAIERFHRLRKRKSDGKLGLVNDRFPFIKLKLMNIDITLRPDTPATETVH